jgi:hypothetical protein
MISQVLNRKVLILSLVLASLALCASVLIPLFAPPDEPVSAALTIIPAPTGTSHLMPATLTNLPPTPTLPPTLMPGEFGHGAYVQISNTGEEGLNLRAQPGLSAPVVFSGFDSEVFLIVDGPEQSDGYTWWHLSASYDATRSGWAAQEFLTLIPSP